MKISIIIPHYNRRELLLSCLDSIAANDYSQNFYEVIVIDDCSTKNIEGIPNYSRIKNYRFYRLGVNSGGASIPRNTGINFAVGDYALFIDSDDTISRGFLSKMIKIAEEGNCDAVIGKKVSERSSAEVFRELTEDIIKINVDNAGKFDRLVFSENYSIGKLFRMSLIKNFGIKFPEILRKSEDSIFNKWFWTVSKTIGICASESYFLKDADSEGLSRLEMTDEDGYAHIYTLCRCICSIPDEFAPLTRKARVINVRIRHDYVLRLLKSPYYTKLLKEKCGKYFLALRDMPQIKKISQTFIDSVLNNNLELQQQNVQSNLISPIVASKDNLSIYIAKLKEKLKGLLIIISSKDTPGNVPRDALLPLGCMNLVHSRLSYVAIINDGKLLFEKLSKNKLDVNDFVQYTNNIDGSSISVLSKGYSIGNVSEIKIVGVDYSLNQRGLNIVVYDKLKKQCVESMNFDTWLKDIPVKRKTFSLLPVNEIKNNNSSNFLNIGLLKTATSFKDYMELLAKICGVCIIVVAAADTPIGMRKSVSLECLGSKQVLGYRNSFIFISDYGNIICDNQSQSNALIYHYNLSNDISISVESKGGADKAYASIKLDGVEKSQNIRGLNLIVLTHSEGIIDNVTFDNYSESIYRDGEIVCDINCLQNARANKIWTAETLAKFLDGTWATPPPTGWFATDFVNTGETVKMENRPTVVCLSGGNTKNIQRRLSNKNCVAVITPKFSDDIPNNIPQLVANPEFSQYKIAHSIRKLLNGKVIGITGSVGKTSTKLMLSWALNQFDGINSLKSYNSPEGIIYTFANAITDPDYLVCEATVHALVKYRKPYQKLIAPHIAIFTPICLSHADEFGFTDEFDVARAKSGLIEFIQPNGVCFIPYEMPTYQILDDVVKGYGAKTISYGFNKGADVWIDKHDIVMRNEESLIRANIFNEIVDYKLLTASEGMILNSLVVLATIQNLGHNIHEAAKYLGEFPIPSSRGGLNKIKFRDGIIEIIDDCANAQPLAVVNAIKTFKHQSSKGRKVLIVGGINTYDPEQFKYKYNELVQPILDANIDVIIMVGGVKILADYLPKEKIKLIFETREDALKRVAEIVELLENNDLVLAKVTSSLTPEYNIANKLIRYINSVVR